MGESSFDLESLKALMVTEVDAQRQQLVDLSLKIHQHPELGFQEFRAAAWLADYLESQGFKVEPGFCELATAFRAGYGSTRPAIAFLAEYDALPKMGHACGHNIIAASAVGAGVAAKAAVDRLGGSVVVIGTPAEELWGGKAIMVERGAFSGIDCALLAHPGVRDTAITSALAAISLEVEFFGKAAHAAARPEEGINALEAMIQSFNAINSLRQHIKEKARIHGIITEGGEAANIVPAHTAGSFLVRAEDDTYLEELRERVLNCFKGASLATGARLEYKWGEVRYAALRPNLALAEVFAKNLEALGRKVEPPNPSRGFGSTDLGNVSLVVPAIHPSVAIAPEGVLAHSPEFAAFASSEAGHKGLLDAAKALAMTAVELIAQPDLLAKVNQEFLKSSQDRT